MSLRLLALMPLALMPAALVAQAPAPADLPGALEAARPDVENLLKAFQPALALERVQQALPASRPPDQSQDYKALLASHDTYRALAGLHLLQARAAFAAGQWEKAQTSAQDALSAARENQAGFTLKSQASLESALKVAQDAQTFRTEKLAQIQQLIAAAKDAKSDPLKLLSLQQSLKGHEEAYRASRQAADAILGARKQLPGDVEAAQKQLAEIEDALKRQQAALAAHQKKTRAKDAKGWVKATLADAGNAALYPTPEAQGAFLHRLAVLDATQTAIPARLQDLRAGKPAFVAPAPRAAKTTKTKKK